MCVCMLLRVCVSVCLYVSDLYMWHVHECIYVYLCVCGVLCVYMWCVHECVNACFVYVCVWVCKARLVLRSIPITLLTSSGCKVPQSNPELSYMASLARYLALGILISDFQALPIQHLCWFWGSKPWPTCLHCNHFNHWAISPAPKVIIWKWLLNWLTLSPTAFLSLWEVFPEGLELYSVLPWYLPLNIHLEHSPGISWLVGFFLSGYCSDDWVYIWILHA